MTDRFAVLVFSFIFLAGGATAVARADSHAGTRLGATEFFCEADKGPIRVLGIEGDVSIDTDGSADRVIVPGVKIIWYCGYVARDWDAPRETEYVRIRRGSDGGGRVEFFGGPASTLIGQEEALDTVR